MPLVSVGLSAYLTLMRKTIKTERETAIMSYVGTYNRLNLHVGASNRDVVRAASKKLQRKVRFDRKHRKERHAFYRTMIKQHRDARKLFDHFRF